MDEETEKWIATRPPEIQEMIRKYPPDGKYCMADEAPYLITSPGTIVEILAYNESGKVLISVLKDGFTRAGLEGIKLRLLENGGPQRLAEFESIIEHGIKAHVDPKYLIPLS